MNVLVLPRIIQDQQSILIIFVGCSSVESDPLHYLYIEVRTWDELAKQKNQPVPDLDIYRSMARKHLQQQYDIS